MKPLRDIAQDARDLLAMERKPTKSDVTHTSAPALPPAHAKGCPHCGRFQPTGVRLCKGCGYEFYPARKAARIPKHMRSVRGAK